MKAISDDCQHEHAFEMEDGTLYCPTCDDMWIINNEKGGYE